VARPSPSRFPTTQQITVRALLRGVPLPEGAHYRVGDQQILILARAKGSDWPDVEVEKGDLEGILWCASTTYGQISGALLTSDRVVSLRVEAPGRDD
jgi:hypothetical protein